MGIENRNNRTPRVVGDWYRWDYSAAGGVNVTHEAKTETVRIEYLDDEIEVPRRQVQFLAEVLLQVSDLYRQAWQEIGRDDYNRPDLPARDRR